MDGASLSAAASTLASLLAILFVVAGAAFFLRRVRAKLPGHAKMQNTINITTSRALGGQHSLVIAEVEGQRFLLGLSRTGITAIGRLGAHE